MRYLRLAFGVLAFLYMASVVAADSNPLANLAWQKGPGKAQLGDKASINIPEGYVFLAADDTKKFLELNQNLSHGDEYLFAPESLEWFTIFRFSPIGYVKDNETIDADALLESVRKGTEAGNEERRKRGWNTMSITGWRYPPHYDNQTKLLEWAFLGKDDSNNKPVINFNTRLLGRTGVMEVVLVADPATIDSSVAAFKTALNDYSFSSGEKYAEFRQGDHVAEYGLAALVAGGAAAVAAKKGFFAVILGFLAAAWKFIAVAVVAGFSWIRSLFNKKNK